MRRKRGRGIGGEKGRVRNGEEGMEGKVEKDESLILHQGDYPQSMKDLVGDRLPQFTDAEKKQLNGMNFLKLRVEISYFEIM
jgi:hypothetical protein